MFTACRQRERERETERGRGRERGRGWYRGRRGEREGEGKILMHMILWLKGMQNTSQGNSCIYPVFELLAPIAYIQAYFITYFNHHPHPTMYEFTCFGETVLKYNNLSLPYTITPKVVTHHFDVLKDFQCQLLGLLHNVPLLRLPPSPLINITNSESHQGIMPTNQLWKVSGI